jgi:hypothetical protein
MIIWCLQLDNNSTYWRNIEIGYFERNPAWHSGKQDRHYSQRPAKVNAFISNHH